MADGFVRSGLLRPDWSKEINVGLAGWWTFLEGCGAKAWDISGKNNHGTLTNGPVWVDGGLKFDGTNDYIAGPANVVTALPVSLHARVKLLSVSATTKVIVQTCDSAAATDYYQGAQLLFNNAKFSLQTGDGAGGADANRKTLGGVTVPVIDKWYNLTGVFISHGDYQLYINGVDDGGTYSGTAATSVFTADPLSIGRWDSSLDRFSNMIVSSCRIWNRALSPLEALQLHLNPNEGLWVPDITRYYIPAAGGADVRKKIISAYMRIAA